MKTTLLQEKLKLDNPNTFHKFISLVFNISEIPEYIEDSLIEKRCHFISILNPISFNINQQEYAVELIKSMKYINWVVKNKEYSSIITKRSFYKYKNLFIEYFIDRGFCRRVTIDKIQSKYATYILKTKIRVGRVIMSHHTFINDRLVNKVSSMGLIDPQLVKKRSVTDMFGNTVSINVLDTRKCRSANLHKIIRNNSIPKNFNSNEVMSYYNYIIWFACKAGILLII